MSITAIQTELLNLPLTERLRMIDVLWESVTEPETKLRETAWASESERRIDAYDSGALGARDAREVFAELKKRLLE